MRTALRLNVDDQCMSVGMQPCLSAKCPTKRPPNFVGLFVLLLWVKHYISTFDEISPVMYVTSAISVPVILLSLCPCRPFRALAILYLESVLCKSLEWSWRVACLTTPFTELYTTLFLLVEIHKGPGVSGEIVEQRWTLTGHHGRCC
jgi:hypothetical protein